MLEQPRRLRPALVWRATIYPQAEVRQKVMADIRRNLPTHVRVAPVGANGIVVSDAATPDAYKWVFAVNNFAQMKKIRIELNNTAKGLL